MTPREFENGYWYLEDLKDFAIQIGLPEARRLRKDEIERGILTFLRTGKMKLPTKRALRKAGVKDLERGLKLNLRIERYTSNRETKDFIIREAKKLAPGVRQKSGVWYRLNRWREGQITKGARPTYGDLVRQYVALNQLERFEKVPQPRYVNFVAEFLAAEKNATRADAIAAWTKLKAMDTPKNYASWVQARPSQLFRFPTAVKRDPFIEDWMRERPGELRAIAQRWFEVMRDCGDDVRELLHDGHPTACVDDAAFGYVNAFRAHVNVGFFRGAELSDPSGLLEGTGKRMRHVKLTPADGVDAAALTKLIQTAYIDMKRLLPQIS